MLQSTTTRYGLAEIWGLSLPPICLLQSFKDDVDLKQDLRCDTVDTREEYELKVRGRLLAPAGEPLAAPASSLSGWGLPACLAGRELGALPWGSPGVGGCSPLPGRVWAFPLGSQGPCCYEAEELH